MCMSAHSLLRETPGESDTQKMPSLIIAVSQQPWEINVESGLFILPLPRHRETPK